MVKKFYFLNIVGLELSSENSCKQTVQKYISPIFSIAVSPHLGQTNIFFTTDIIMVY